MPSLQWPLSSMNVSQEFAGDRGGHPGMDLAAPQGTPIHACGDGTALPIVPNPNGYGNFCRIAHTPTIQTVYGHMVSPPLISPGDPVTKGQVIGYVGSTGKSTGPHLHLEVQVNNVVQNPRNFIDTNGSFNDSVRAPAGETGSAVGNAVSAVDNTPLDQAFSFIGGGAWTLGREVQETKDTNLPFDPRNTHLFAGPYTPQLTKGVIRAKDVSWTQEVTQNGTGAGGGGVGTAVTATAKKVTTEFHFMFNPSQVDVSLQFDPSMLQAQDDLSQADKASPMIGPIGATVSFSLLIDRRYDVAYGAVPDGVLFDLHILEKLIGIEKKSGGISSSTVEVAFSPAFKFAGFIAQMNAQMVSFSYKMVPTVMRLDISLFAPLGLKPKWMQGTSAVGGTSTERSGNVSVGDGVHATKTDTSNPALPVVPGQSNSLLAASLSANQLVAGREYATS